MDLQATQISSFVPSATLQVISDLQLDYLYGPEPEVSGE